MSLPPEPSHLVEPEPYDYGLSELQDEEQREREERMNPQSVDDRDDRQLQEANDERLWRLEEAIREALTKGVSMESIRILCFESGASYSRVCGESTGERSDKRSKDD